ncbi:hypothetical protein B0H14DRAFT_3517757 [Mycena olivaceomarginata]|nr:hypothetical protein B0H14DRAFT_3517757 [Mycena olivaceomarginata]
MPHLISRRRCRPHCIYRCCRLSPLRRLGQLCASIGQCCCPTASPVAAVSTSASEASVASSCSSFRSGVHSTCAVGSGLDFNFDFSFLDHLSFGHELHAEEDVLRLNTSNRDDDNWDFGGCTAASHWRHVVVLQWGHETLVLPNVNTATTASTSSTSIFSVATNTTGNKKRKRSGDDGGEKRPRKTRSDKDKPRGPRKSTTNAVTVNAAA